MSEEQRPFYIRPLANSDRNWVAQFMDEHWGSTKIVSRGQVYYGHLLPGFAAFEGSPDDEKEGAAIGLITFRIDGKECEIVTIDSIKENMGIGTALVETIKSVAQAEKLRRLWLITTNDNLNALKFYQKRGFHLAAIYPDALAESRKLKPQIPLVGMHDIPLRDEIELEMLL